MRIGVIIPSRLQTRPGGRDLVEFGPELWLDGALANVAHQDWGFLNVKIFVGVDEGALVPAHISNHATVVWSPGRGQSATVNVAAAAALGWGADILLFLEDDDRWLRAKTTIQLPMLDHFDFVSCSQELVDEKGRKVGTNDYPVPSSWGMKASVWETVGGFNENMKWLVDTEWLGRLSQSKIRRAHLIPEGTVDPVNKLSFVSKFSEVVPCSEREFLVARTVNGRGGMATISGSKEAGDEADAEAEAMRKRFGFDPW